MSETNERNFPDMHHAFESYVMRGFVNFQSTHGLKSIELPHDFDTKGSLAATVDYIM